jgi:hypothetical protein
MGEINNRFNYSGYQINYSTIRMNYAGRIPLKKGFNFLKPFTVLLPLPDLNGRPSD